MAQEAVDELLQQAALEAGGIPQDLVDAIRAAGREPNNSTRRLPGKHRGDLDWKQLLRRYAGRILKSYPVFYRPPRRFPDFVGILPGRCRRRSRAAVLAIIDTSGSISPQALDEIDGEICRLARTRPVHVVECDCEVHKVYRYKKSLQHVTGGGGTDFRPALNPKFLRPLKPELIIYFTDGFGAAPSAPPSCSLIWCLVPGGDPPAEYGRVVRMGE